MALILGVITCLVFVIGCIGNGIFVAIYAKHKQLKNVRNWFLLNIAVADLIAAAITALITCVTEFQPLQNWIFGVAVCKVYHFLLFMCSAVSIFTLAALSIERCVSQYNRPCKFFAIPRKIAAGLLILLWVIPVIINIPHMVFSTAHKTHVNASVSGEVCYSQANLNQYNLYLALEAAVPFVFQFAIPILAIAVSYIIIFIAPGQRNQQPARATNESTSQQHGSSGQPGLQGTDQTTNTTTKTTRFTNLVLVLVLVYFLCWFPLHISRMWFFFGTSEYTRVWARFRLFAECMSYIDCCLRAWFVFVLDPTFKQFFLRDVCCCFTSSSFDNVVPLDDRAEEHKQASQF